MDEETFVFGSFRLIPAQRMLLEDEKPLRLGSRALDILVTLVESAGETIGKDLLIARTWPDTVVDEGRCGFTSQRCARRSGMAARESGISSQPRPGLQLRCASGARTAAAGNRPNDQNGRARQFAGATHPHCWP
jgi:DNA-binding winged helix-turn-helix (wHTH) protein